MATRSRYCLFMAKEKLRIIEEAENIGNHAAGRKYDVSKRCIHDWRKKTKCDLQRRIVIVRYFTPRKRGISSLKKDYAITWMIKDNTDMQLLVNTKELGIMDFKVILLLSQVAAGERVPTWLVVGISAAWQRPTVYSTCMPCWPLLA